MAGVPVIAIEHVGSTSVVGFAAKPIIDCDIIVERAHAEAASAALVSLGFTPPGEGGVPLRWAFNEPERLSRTNTYVVVAGSLSLRNHLAVRDTLRADPELRDEYGEVKKQLGSYATDSYAYVSGKNTIVQRVLEASRLSEKDRAAIAGNQLPIKH